MNKMLSNSPMSKQRSFIVVVVFAVISLLFGFQAFSNTPTTGLSVSDSFPAQINQLYTMDAKTNQLYRFYANRSAETNNNDALLEKVGLPFEFVTESVTTIESDFVNAGNTLFIAGLKKGTINENMISRYDVLSNTTKNYAFAKTGAQTGTDITDMAIDIKGNIYFADRGNQRIWSINNQLEAGSKVDVTGIDSDANTESTQASKLILQNPGGLVFDRYGNLIVTDTDSHRVLALKPNPETGIVDKNSVVVQVAGNPAAVQASLAVDDSSGYWTTPGASSRDELLREWVGTPTKPAVDHHNNLYYYDTTDKVWVKLTDEKSGNTTLGVSNLGYTHLYSKGVQRDFLSPKAGLDGALISDMVADAQVGEKHILASGQTHIGANIYAYANSGDDDLGDMGGNNGDKESEAISYQRALRPVSFNDSTEIDPYGYDGKVYTETSREVTVAKNGANFSLDFFTQASSIEEGQTRILFSIGGDDAKNYTESLYVGLKKVSGKYRVILAQRGKNISKRVIIKNYNRAGGLVSDPYSDTDSVHYQEIAAFYYAIPSELENKWSNLTINFSPVGSNTEIKAKLAHLSEEKTTINNSTLNIDSFKQDVKYYRIPETCVAEYFDWDGVNVTRGSPAHGHFNSTSAFKAVATGFWPYACVKSNMNSYWYYQRGEVVCKFSESNCYTVNNDTDGVNVGDMISTMGRLSAGTGQVYEFNDANDQVLLFPKGYYLPNASEPNTIPGGIGSSISYYFTEADAKTKSYSGYEHFPALDSNNNDTNLTSNDFKGSLRVGGFSSTVSGFKPFKGMIANLSINGTYYQDSRYHYDKQQRFPSALTGLAVGSFKVGSDHKSYRTLSIIGKNSSPTLHRIIGSDIQPKTFRFTSSATKPTIRLPKYIAIDNKGNVYYEESEAKAAESRSSDIELVETHVLNKFYPPNNHDVPFNKTDIDASSANNTHYEYQAQEGELAADATIYVEYKPQYRVVVSAIRPLNTDDSLAFSDNYAGLPVNFDYCPESYIGLESFSNTKVASIESYLGKDENNVSIFSKVLGLDKDNPVVNYDDLDSGMSYCRKRVWLDATVDFEPEVQGVVYNPVDNAGKRYRLVRIHGSGSLGTLEKNYRLNDNYNSLGASALKLDGAGEITYIWLEQYLVKVNTSKSKTSKFARLRIDGVIQEGYEGDGNFWVDKGSKVELLMPVENNEFTLQGFNLKEQGQDEIAINLESTDANSSSEFEQVTIGEVEYYAIEIGEDTQGLNNMVNINWDFGDRVYQYELTLGQEFIPGVTTTTDGFTTDEILTRKINAIQGASHDPAVFLPLTLNSYIDAKTNKAVVNPPKPPEATSKLNAYVWQSQDRTEELNPDTPDVDPNAFKGAMYFTRPGVYQLEWLLGGEDYPIEGTEGFQKLVTTVIVKWPETIDFTHIGGTPDIALEASETDGIKFKELRYTESKTLKVESGVLKYPEWDTEDDPSEQFSDGKITAPRSVFVFTQSKEPGKAAVGDFGNEKIIVAIAETKQWNTQLKDDVSTVIGSEITSDFHGDDIGHNGYLVQLTEESSDTASGVLDKAPYNAATYNRSTMKGELFAVNQEQGDASKVYKDGKHDLAVVWFKRLKPQNVEPLEAIESVWPAWPHQAVRYKPEWPDTNDESTDRIVIASRMGSDSLNNKDAEEPQLKFATNQYSNLLVYNQPDENLPGYNPNEEHAIVAKSWRYRTESSVPDAVFALRNDLNRADPSEESYTSKPFVLAQYKDLKTDKYGMKVYKIQVSDAATQDVDVADKDESGNPREFSYDFQYWMEVGQTVIAPYPLNDVIGANSLLETRGENANPNRITYWEDRKATPWAISGGGGAKLYSYFWYPMQAAFWHPTAKTGDVIPFGAAGDYVSDGGANTAFNSRDAAQKEHKITYHVEWPEKVPELRIGETLTFSGGEHKNDDSSAEGLPGAIGWASAEIVFDSQNPTSDVSKAADPTAFSARLHPVLREIKVDLAVSDFPDEMLPATKRTEVSNGVWFFAELHAGLKQRIYYDNSAGKLVMRGFVNDKTAGDSSLQAAPPVDYILQPNVLTDTDHSTLVGLSGANTALKKAFTQLLALSRNPTLTNEMLSEVKTGDSATYAGQYLVGLSQLLRDANNRLFTASSVPLSADDIARLPNGQLPTGISNSTADLEIIDDDVLSKLDQLPVGFTVEDLNTINQLMNAQEPRKLVRIKKSNSYLPATQLGSGLALMTNPNLLDPDSAATKNFNESYVVIAENNDPVLDGNTVSLKIVKVNNKPFRGMIKTILSDNVFDEKIALRHTGDFGGNAEDLVFDWRYIEAATLASDLRLTTGYKPPSSEPDPSCPVEPTNVPASSDLWKSFVDERPGNKKGLGWNELTFGNKTGKDVLVDNSFMVRYIHKDCLDDGSLKTGAEYQNCKWSGWTGAANGYPCDAPPNYQPQLVEGWVKRVTSNVNQYDARINDFSTDGAPATYVSMLQQAGQMYEGDVALNGDKDVIENTGLIELYQTVLNRASGLSIDADQTSVGVTQALQNAASRITQFYTLLGNEAYSDALDPTIGFSSNSDEYGTLAPTIFTFQNQLSSLGEEELALLRGRADKGAKPAYNRLLWNFTNGDGEAAYALSYNVTDLDKNGEINEADARAMYPQGHGDAWGHYMSAMQTYYDLLRHPMFTWETRAESFQIEGVTLDVDYLDERRFAEAASYKAKAGAEIVTQTYRDLYVEDPNGQWQGYKDTEASRAWGVDGWARRAHQGAYYDWVTTAALIPAKSTKVGIQKIDRTTVTELQEISAEGIKVLTELAQIDNGLNPLGLLPDVVPFDISPGSDETQFKQVLARAESAIDNALNVFDYANDLKHRIRKVADTQEEFTEQVEKQDREYRNRLIELFGTPYEGVIGPGKVYPEGYSGPDTKFYRYIDVGEISSKTLPPPSKQLTAYINDKAADRYEYEETELDEETIVKTGKAVIKSGSLDAVTGLARKMIVEKYVDKFFPTDFEPEHTIQPVSVDINGVDEADFTLQEINYPISDGDYSFTAPDHWEQRESVGELQIALANIVKADADFRLVYDDYSSILADLKDQERRDKVEKDLGERIDAIKERASDADFLLGKTIQGLEFAKENIGNVGNVIKGVSNAVVTALPKVVGFSSDVTSSLRGVSVTASNIATGALEVSKIGLTGAKMVAEQSKELVPIAQEVAIDKVNIVAKNERAALEMNRLLEQEPIKRLQLFKAREQVRQAAENFRALEGKAQRLLEERDTFNKKVAAKTHGKRYQDMAFRLNRTEASQKYRAAFDMAAKYVYLAAKAYDYETNLSETHSASALPLLSEIIQARSLGQFFGGEAVVGMGGLADVLARMKANYSVLKTQMGINNPQLETEPFSLRSELFRLRDNEQAFNQAFAALNAGRKTAISLDYEAFTEATDAQLMEKGLTSDEVKQLRIDSDSGASWRRVLRKHYVDDLWTDLPQFRTHMRPFAAEDNGKQPALVIPFSTNIISGQNFFGWPLSANDHAYDPSQFATRIRSVGIFIKGKDGGYNYDSLGLAATPRAYLVPVGQDVMYVPDSYELDTREWDVKDQKIPVPLPTGQSDLESGDWMPLNALDGPDGQIRRHSQMRVYNDSDGVVDASELNGDTRLYGRSVWNSQWLLVIPGAGLLSDATEGLNTLIDGNVVPGDTSKRDGNGIDDIKLTFKTYAYSGN